MALTQNWTNFFVLQMFRLLTAITLTCLTGIICYIYMKRLVFLLSFYSLLSTTLTFWLLFIGSGMQVCEQKNLMSGKKSERKILSKLWRKGLFLYNQSLALAFTSTFIFWYENKFHVMEDLKLIMQVYLVKNNNDEQNWRYKVTYLIHILPAAALLIEMSMNRLGCRYIMLSTIFCLLASTFS